MNTFITGPHPQNRVWKYSGHTVRGELVGGAQAQACVVPGHHEFLCEGQHLENPSLTGIKMLEVWNRDR